MWFDAQALALGAVQGLTEFLPVSSSGHLALLQMFFGFPAEGDSALFFDILLHCATMLAVLIFFGRDCLLFLSQWANGFFSQPARRLEGWNFGWCVIVGTVATVILALPLEPFVKSATVSPFAVGVGLLCTAGLLCCVPVVPERDKSLNIRVALIIGLAQGAAVFPGLSRSGATIAAALFCGLSARDAFRFSFLLSVPAIFGATLLEGLKAAATGFYLPEGWAAAALVAFVLGLLSLSLLRRLVLSGKWAYFGVWCFLLGIFVVISQTM
ncbi:undecaprenyl-diphosphatase [Synergistales bacterium]|nr:undecaprenyl-diphosphatase [Synergistales bacterium]